MPANFSELRLRYIHVDNDIDLSPDLRTLAIVFKLSSLNFDINHATIGASTPFTSEMSFVLGIEDHDDSTVSSLRDVSRLLNAHFEGTAIQLSDPDPTEEDRVKQITTFLQDATNGVFRGHLNTSSPPSYVGNLRLLFHNIHDGASIIPSTSLQVLATPVNIKENELFNLAWFVKIKFHAVSPVFSLQSPPTINVPSSESAVLYPELVITGGNAELTLTTDDNGSFSSLNDELKMNFELTYIPEPPDTTPFASPIGKATDELTDSLANLTNSLAANLTSTFKTQLQPAGTSFSEDTALWVLIKKGTDELSFTRFFNYMEAIFCGEDIYPLTSSLADKARTLHSRRSMPFMNVDAYRAVKIAAEAFVMVNCMVNRGFSSHDIDELRKSVRLVDGVPDEAELTKYYNNYKVAVNGADDLIPYLAVIRRKLSNENIKMTSFEDAFDHYMDPLKGKAPETCYGIISDKLTYPCYLELIWSYWHEESMMVQGLNAVCRRFQNIRGPGKVDPLANLEIDPLRPLNNLMWGYIQDAQHRLSVRRRAYEYNHHYGITLKGEAAREMRFADPRSKFIEAFHTLLNLASRFYKQSDDMTVRPDGFPILNGLRETHLILSEGAHNQYGDLPSTSRAEMLMEQWLLARPEFRDFLPTRIMIAYPEPWMDRVAALNQMLGHTKTSVLHFNYLAIFGEKILLSIRYGNWADPSNRADAASSWAHFWRQEIQGYIHAYRAVTGVDLSADGVIAGQRVDTQQPSAHLFRKLTEQQSSNGQTSKGAA